MTKIRVARTGLMAARNLFDSKSPKLTIYEDANKKWRWKIFMSSDEVAASTQGYKDKSECIDNLKKITNYIQELERTGKLI